MSTVVARGRLSVADLVEALRAQQQSPGAVSAPVGEPPTREGIRAAAWTLLVLAAHPGAGATTVSVALSDALSNPAHPAAATEPPGGSVCLIDAAGHEVSGMTAAAACEVGAHGDGWRTGRRGPSRILRPVVSPRFPGDLPDLGTGDRGWSVIDAGWPWREVLADANPIRTLVKTAHVVVVCRATVPGVRNVELALEALPGRPLVAAVGARRWPSVVRASFGPRLAQTVGEARAVLVPRDRRVEVNGLDAEGLPRAISEAASALVGVLWPETVGSAPQLPTKGLHR